jgi:putative NADH-flavin reductase
MENKKIIVFGATGKTGRLVCSQLLKNGASVSGFGRSAEKIKSIDENLLVAQGNIHEYESISKAIANHQAVIVCLGSTSLKDKSTLSTGTKNIVEAMTHHNIKRLIVISAAGVGESWSQISWLPRFLFKTLLRNVFADHIMQEQIVKKSSLDWTIVRAAVLTNKAASGNYQASNTTPVRKIARADLAEFLVHQVLDKSYIQKTISVTS